MTDSPVRADSSTRNRATSVQAQIRGHQVASLQKHHVAGDQMLGLHHLYLALGAAHGGLRRGHALQSLQGLVGLPFLPEANDGVQHHDEHDDQRVSQVADTAPDKTAAASSTRIMKSRNWSSSRFQAGRGGDSGRRFGPCRC